MAEKWHSKDKEVPFNGRTSQEKAKEMTSLICSIVSIL